MNRFEETGARLGGRDHLARGLLSSAHLGPGAGLTPPQPSGPRNILFVCNASAPCGAAQSYAFSLAHKYGSRLTFLDVLEQRWDRVVARVVQFDCSGPEAKDVLLEDGLVNLAQFQSGTGTLTDLVLLTADHIASDLTVLSAPRRHWLGDRVVPSSVYEVLLGSKSPVLTVRPQ